MRSATDLPPGPHGLIVAPGLHGLIVRATPDIDWDAVARRARSSGFAMLGHFDLDDPGANFERLAAAEHAAADVGSTDAPARADRRQEWQLLDAEDVRLRPWRMLVTEFDRMAARRTRAWDPRLDEIGDLIAASRRFWVAALPADTAPRAAPAGDGVLVRRMRAARQPDMHAMAAAEIAARRRALGADSLAVAQCLAAARVARICDDVAGHAGRLAARVGDAARAAEFRNLAESCSELAEAARFCSRYGF